ncbi:MAG: TatD family hydrolase [Alphaproteobacteria bacterium]|nr:TatD family hydrolase [Alphaproteobacteria bacterium]
MFFIDSHCHLLSFDQNEIEKIISSAKDQNVLSFVTISTQIDDFEKNYQIAKRFDNIYISIGIHPEYAEISQKTSDELIQYVNKFLDKTIAIGETGLDYYYPGFNKNKQKYLFEQHLIAASKLNLPVSIHTRSAELDTIDILSKHKENKKILLHCFSSDENLLNYGLENDFYFSASGIITFNKAEEVRTAFKKIPLDRILIETDSPYLAPTPYRGKKNEPSFLVKTAEKLAEIKQISVQDISNVTTTNFYNLFTKAKKIC